MADLTVPWALRAAVGAQIPQIVAAGDHTFDSLRLATVADARGLDALVRVLVRCGVLAVDDGLLSLTELGERLLPGHPESRRADLDPSGVCCRLESAFAGLPAALGGVVTAYESVHGLPFWEDLAADQELAERFDRHLARWAVEWAPTAAADPVWRGASLAVDVGGGLGMLAAELVRTHPGVHVVVAERPGTVERCRAELVGRPGVERVRVEEHDAFESLPAAGDVYVLAQMLHDCDDTTASRLLRSVVDAAGRGARLAVIERLPAPKRIFDHMHLLLFAVLGAGERSRAEYVDLLHAAGLVVQTPRPLVGGMWLTECVVR